MPMFIGIHLKFYEKDGSRNVCTLRTLNVYPAAGFVLRT